MLGWENGDIMKWNRETVEKNRQQKIRQKQSVIVMDNRMEITQNDN